MGEARDRAACVSEPNILRYERALLQSPSEKERPVVLRLLEQARRDLTQAAEEPPQPARSLQGR